MSNTTEAPRENGGGNKRRRRSRGGQNRRKNNENSSSNGENRRQGGQGGRGGQGGQGGKPRRRPMPKPAQLTWWQKFLKALGLYKEPVKPARKTRAKAADGEPRAPKSNTRVARNAKRDDGEAPTATATAEPRERDERRPRKSRERGERGEGRKGGERSEGRKGGDPDSVESSRVYVGNLSYDATEQDLKELFKGVGPVRNVEIVYDRKTHRSKGFGFVEMIHVDEAKRAVEVLHDQFFLGREMVVSGAKKKGQDEREDNDEVRDEPSKPVELAPLPPAAAIEPDPNEKVAASAPVEPAVAATSELVTSTPDEPAGKQPEESKDAKTEASAAESQDASGPTEEASPERPPGT